LKPERWGSPFVQTEKYNREDEKEKMMVVVVESSLAEFLHEHNYYSC
jgi:hypothetical protein